MLKLFTVGRVEDQVFLAILFRLQQCFLIKRPKSHVTKRKYTLSSRNCISEQFAE